MPAAPPRGGRRPGPPTSGTATGTAGRPAPPGSPASAGASPPRPGPRTGRGRRATGTPPAGARTRPGAGRRSGCGDRLHRARAGGALRGREGDRRQAVGAVLGRLGRLGRTPLEAGRQAIDWLHDEEERRRRNGEERDHIVDQVTVEEVTAVDR